MTDNRRAEERGGGIVAKRVARLCEPAPGDPHNRAGILGFFISRYRTVSACVSLSFSSFSFKFLAVKFFPFFFSALSRFSVFVLLRWTLRWTTNRRLPAWLPTPSRVPFFFSSFSTLLNFAFSFLSFLFFSLPFLHFLHFLVFPFFLSHPSSCIVVHTPPSLRFTIFWNFAIAQFFSLDRTAPLLYPVRRSPNFPFAVTGSDRLKFDGSRQGPLEWRREGTHTDHSLPQRSSPLPLPLLLYACLPWARDADDWFLHLAQIQLLLEIANQVNPDPNWRSINIPGGL